MRSHIVIESPVGPLTLVAQDGALVGLYMDLQRHRPDDEDLGEDEPEGRQAEPFKNAADQLDAYFTGSLTRFTLPLPNGASEAVWVRGVSGVRVPATGLGCPVEDSLRRDRVLRRAGRTYRFAGCRTGGGSGQRQEPDRHCHPVSPGGGLERQPDRLRRGSGPQEAAARTRAGGLRDGALLGWRSSLLPPGGRVRGRSWRRACRGLPGCRPSPRS